MIAFLHIGSPAVDAAHAPHGVADCNHRPAGGGKLIGMAGLAELLGGVGDGRKTGIIKIRLPEGAGPLSGIPALGGKMSPIRETV